MLHKLLRAKLTELGMEHAYFAKKLGIGASSLSLKMTGKSSWDLDLAYRAMDVLSLPYERLHEFFPKSGATYEPALTGADLRVLKPGNRGESDWSAYL